MTYEQFVERMKERVRAALAPGRSVRLRSALKNNGRHRKGLVFTEAGVNTSPTIYLEEYYERYQAGSSFEEVAGARSLPCTAVCAWTGPGTGSACPGMRM